MVAQENKKVHCSQHGETNPAYACCHLVSSLRDGVERGLVFVRDDDNQYNGWCGECDEFFMANGEEWNDRTEGFAKISLICEGCFERLIKMNNVS